MEPGIHSPGLGDAGPFCSYPGAETPEILGVPGNCLKVVYRRHSVAVLYFVMIHVSSLFAVFILFKESIADCCWVFSPCFPGKTCSLLFCTETFEFTIPDCDIRYSLNI